MEEAGLALLASSVISALALLGHWPHGARSRTKSTGRAQHKDNNCRTVATERVQQDNSFGKTARPRPRSATSVK